MNRIEHIVQSASISDLQDGGIMPTAIGDSQPRTRTRVLAASGIRGADSGVWECSPGTFRRATANAEVMHFIAGECTFTRDGGDPIHISAGDTVAFPANTQGVWVVRSTIRKVYVSLSEAFAA